MLLFFLIFSLLSDNIERSAFKTYDEIKRNEEEKLKIQKFIKLFSIFAEKKMWRYKEEELEADE